MDIRSDGDAKEIRRSSQWTGYRCKELTCLVLTLRRCFSSSPRSSSSPEIDFRSFLVMEPRRLPVPPGLFSSAF